MDILDDIGVSKLSATFFFFKVNYSFKMKSAIPLCVIDYMIHRLCNLFIQ